jgi:hypothetical protein
MAEVYRDLEWTMLQQDLITPTTSVFHDRLRDGHARPVRDHLRAGLDYQNKLARSWRITTNREQLQPFQLICIRLRLPSRLCPSGLRFFHQGQLQSRTKRISPHLVRAPHETVIPEMQHFYRRLLEVLRQPVVRDGQWQLLECVPAWQGNWTWDCFLAFTWEDSDGQRLLVTVNFAPNQSQCYVRLPCPELPGGQWRLLDQLADIVYERDVSDLQSRGLYLDTPAWNASAPRLGNSRKRLSNRNSPRDKRTRVVGPQ